ncbi:hypothetical protein M0813_20481 [Anaeramoeba flamelloides]|uniref:Uncharacterized protein n=1 Tax=Anaeramoeba flamelloides TaxID=1746091 RepID=A0ABQ8YL30_9EUKA|nr:hypothetical protein M0813_20481 [Anaeramoeba flamelloides]
METTNRNTRNLSFYSILWKFGKYLESTLVGDQEFVPNELIDVFVQSTFQPTDFKRAKKYLQLISNIFNQNLVTLQSISQKKRNRKSKNQKKTKTLFSIAEESQYTLNSVWRTLFKDQEITKATTAPQSNSLRDTKLPDNYSRKYKTIGFLSLKMSPSTREGMEKKTGFLRQRVCTVLSVYKTINLVEEDKKTNHLFWNNYQADLLPDLKKHILLIIKLRNLKRELSCRVRSLLGKYQTRMKNSNQFKNSIIKNNIQKNELIKKLFPELISYISSACEEKINNIQLKESSSSTRNYLNMNLFQKVNLATNKTQKIKIKLNNSKFKSYSIIELSKKNITNSPRKKHRRKTNSKRKIIVTKFNKIRNKTKQSILIEQNKQLPKENQMNQSSNLKLNTIQNQNLDTNLNSNNCITNEKEILKKFEQSITKHIQKFNVNTDYYLNSPQQNKNSFKYSVSNERTNKETEAIEAILSLTLSSLTEDNKLNSQPVELIQNDYNKNNTTRNNIKQYASLPLLLSISKQYENN